jgi:ABC-2 type transport system permease protein
VVRNRRYLLFALAVPVGAYLLFGKALGHGGTVRGIGGTTFFMVSMAAYSAMLAVVFMGGARQAAERTRGWTELLRVTPLPAWG